MVKRYDLEVTGFGDDFYTVMGECDGGEFVRHDDYEEVADKLADCQMQIKWLQDKIAGPQCLR